MASPPTPILAESHQQPQNETWNFLSKDPCSRFFLLWLGLVNLPYFVPIFTPDQHVVYTNLYANFLLLPAVILALLHRLQETTPRERKFWSYMVAAFGFWWIVAAVYLLTPYSWAGMGLDFATDGLYMLCYLSFFLAIETMPHWRPDIADNRRIRFLESAGTIVLVLSEKR